MKTVATLAVGLLLSGDGPVAGAPQPCPSIAGVSAKLLIERTCAELRERLATVRGATVSKAGAAFLDPRLGCTRMGCVVKLQGSFKGLRGAAPPDEWLRGEYFASKGWREVDSYAADGPNGTSYAMHQPGAMCIVGGEWNHWDAQDGPHLDDAYAVTVSCGPAEHSAPQPPAFAVP